jgi:hypothetical protein
MPLAYFFWAIYVLCIVFGSWAYYEPASPNWRQRLGGGIALWILVGMLGYHEFGSVVK